MTDSLNKSIPRRHDLDALRAFAMFLGIALHGALSFVEFPWPVQDSRQHDLFGLFFFAVHGFRQRLLHDDALAETRIEIADLAPVPAHLPALHAWISHHLTDPRMGVEESD